MVKPVSTDDDAVKQPCEKTKEELKAERKAVFLAKRAAVKEQQKQQPGNKEKVTHDEGDSKEKTHDEKNVEKTKAELKAERRRIQEMQRATKKMEQGKGKPKTKQEVPITEEASKTKSSPKPKLVPKGSGMKNLDKMTERSPVVQPRHLRMMQLLSHLRQSERNMDHEQIPNIPLFASIKEIGFQMLSGNIIGSTARCLALLGAVKDVIQKYKTPPEEEISQHLDGCLDKCYDYLNMCRPHNVCMSSAIKDLKRKIRRIPSDMEEKEAKKHLFDTIDNFVKINIVNAQELISETAATKIQDGDVILTYACSTSVQKAFLHAHNDGKDFQVIVADGRPKNEGEHMLRFLKKNDIRCSYILITSIASVMHEVKRVMMGAHSLHTNGAVMSRVGTSQIALIAKAFNKPVLICCETYKFSENVSVDSFVFNELGFPSDMICSVLGKGKILENWERTKSLYLLNLTYDVTPPELVSVVITEKGMLPCSSVPVVLRVKGNQQLM